MGSNDHRHVGPDEDEARPDENGVRRVVGGRVVTPQSVINNATVVIEQDRITDIKNSNETPCRDDIRADGKFILPGLVDLHGDEHERYLQPRDGADIPADAGMLACDRTNLTSGVTTKFHAVSFEETPSEDRSVDRGLATMSAIRQATGLLADHRIHARCEIANESCVATVRDLLDEVDLVSLMNHVPGDGQFDERQFERRYGTTDGGTIRLREERQLQPGTEVPTAATLIKAAHEAGSIVAVHDTEDPELIEEYDSLGVQICEYPLTLTAARRATELGMKTVLGAPNVVRGHSMWGNLNALEAIASGVVDVLTSDFHPYSMLLAPFIDTGEPLPARIARVSCDPADAVGLTDRGRIEPGARADLIVVDPAPIPRVESVIVEGEEVYRVGRPRATE